MSSEIPFQKVREEMAPYFKAIIIALVVLIAALLLVTVLIAFREIETVEKVALIELLQVGVALIIGLTSIAIGFLLAWFNIASAYSIGAQGGGGGVDGKFNLVSNSPGIFFAIVGCILIIAAILKPIHYVHEGGVTRQPL